MDLDDPQLLLSARPQRRDGAGLQVSAGPDQTKALLRIVVLHLRKFGDLAGEIFTPDQRVAVPFRQGVGAHQRGPIDPLDRAGPIGAVELGQTIQEGPIQGIDQRLGLLSTGFTPIPSGQLFRCRLVATSGGDLELDPDLREQRLQEQALSGRTHRSPTPRRRHPKLGRDRRHQQLDVAGVTLQVHQQRHLGVPKAGQLLADFVGARPTPGDRADLHQHALQVGIGQGLIDHLAQAAQHHPLGRLSSQDPAHPTFPSGFGGAQLQDFALHVELQPAVGQKGPGSPSELEGAEEQSPPQDEGRK
jgi:hypothetical protein